MKYHAETKQFLIDPKDLEFAVMSFRYAIKHIRLASGLPLDKYKQDGPMEHPDYAMRAIIEIADRLGIEMGVRWGNELDVRDAG